MKVGAFEAILLIAIVYVTIGVWSLAEMAMGSNVEYMPFWHAPWRWLFDLFS